MNGWNPMKDAPRDGTWILIEGEMYGGDTSGVTIARWEPIFTETGVYEWRAPSLGAIYAGAYAEVMPPDDAWNWYPEGRVSGWLPLPEVKP